MCSGEALLEGLGLVPLAIKRICVGDAVPEALVMGEIDALKAVSGTEHMIQMVDFKFTVDRSLCYVITRWVAAPNLGGCWNVCDVAACLTRMYNVPDALHTPLPLLPPPPSPHLPAASDPPHPTSLLHQTPLTPPPCCIRTPSPHLPAASDPPHPTSLLHQDPLTTHILRGRSFLCWCIVLSQ